jgi:hypothetical protein
LLDLVVEAQRKDEVERLGQGTRLRPPQRAGRLGRA